MASRAAVYLRVSTEVQNTEMQEASIRKYVELKGWQIAEIYQDKLSGANTNRPNFQRMLQDAEAGKFDTVVTYRLDRFSRSLRDLLTTLHLLEKLKIDFVSVNDNLDFSTSAGRLMAHLLGAIAQFERELIHSRVIAGLQNARRKGVKLGRPKCVPESDIMILRKQGLSLSAIAKRVGFSRSAVHKTVQRLSSKNLSTIVEFIEIQDPDKSVDKSKVLDTPGALPLGIVQCHEEDYKCLEKDFTVTNDSKGSSKC